MAGPGTSDHSDIAKQLVLFEVGVACLDRNSMRQQGKNELVPRSRIGIRCYAVGEIALVPGRKSDVSVPV